ncbi:hypothetical protein Gohar_002520 [Gossypium harknessii]|uniref:Uncharacterized protein n=1 Tax=Gossypium harknessii TaxID=34285 RepID=A0A7J9HMB0_9ROSI|nr:hypothetical protein [Gossypium harknessii]
MFWPLTPVCTRRSARPLMQKPSPVSKLCSQGSSWV